MSMPWPWAHMAKCKCETETETESKSQSEAKSQKAMEEKHYKIIQRSPQEKHFPFLPAAKRGARAVIKSVKSHWPLQPGLLYPEPNPPGHRNQPIPLSHCRPNSLAPFPSAFGCCAFCVLLSTFILAFFFWPNDLISCISLCGNGDAY